MAILVIAEHDNKQLKTGVANTVAAASDSPLESAPMHASIPLVLLYFVNVVVAKSRDAKNDFPTFSFESLTAISIVVFGKRCGFALISLTAIRKLESN